MKILIMVSFMLYISSGCVMFDTRSNSQRNMEECVVRLIGEGATPNEAKDACVKIYRPSSASLDQSTDIKMVRE
jgi:hypothetical protein